MSGHGPGSPASGRLTYAAPFAPHVTGCYAERRYDHAERRYVEQVVALHCSHCGAEARWVCQSGRARDKVLKFALSHLHRDPLGNPGS
jgi:hypothetical protein